jgi:hypothetical protein
MQQTYTSIDFSSFHSTYGLIQLPGNMLLYRGYDTHYPAITDRPAYFTHNKIIANGYVNNTSKKLGYFRTTQTLRLFDLRFIKVLLSEMFNSQKPSILTSSEIVNCIYSITLSLGLCSYNYQLNNLVPRRYNNPSKNIQKAIESMKLFEKNTDIEANPIEKQGIRIAETTNDHVLVCCLSKLFEGIIDGYIMPDIYSPFHIEKTKHILPAEIVLFNPQSIHLEQLTNEPNVFKKHMNEYILQQNYNYIEVKNSKMKSLSVYIKGGTNTLDYDRNHFFDVGGKEYITLKKKTNKAMCKLIKPPSFYFATAAATHESQERPIESVYEPVAPHPTYEVTPWTI